MARMGEPGVEVRPDGVGADPYLVELDRFQGPLDLLLHLIRAQDIDIFDIPIATITAQFLAAVRQVERLELERAGEFLEMAATLVRIKAQTLFPRKGVDGEEEDPRADLVRRLLEYEHFRDAADLLQRAERERALQHGKGYLEARPRPPLSDVPLETTWEEVDMAIDSLVERLTAVVAQHRITAPLIRVEERMEVVMRALADARRVEFRSLIQDGEGRMHAAASLLACLELAKRDALRLRQASPFAPLWLYPADRQPE
jgi:segregation and condensation protein A